MSVEKQVAVVTGGSGGIGEAAALRLAKDGYRVAVVASSRVERAEAVAEAIRAQGGVATGFACDVRDPAACNALVEAVIERYGRVDTLVNCAGVFIPTPVGAAKQADVQQMIDINLLGTWNMINSVIPSLNLLRDKGGHCDADAFAGLRTGPLEYQRQLCCPGEYGNPDERRYPQRPRQGSDQGPDDFSHAQSASLFRPGGYRRPDRLPRFRCSARHARQLSRHG
jgi:hypothetical protein